MIKFACFAVAALLFAACSGGSSSAPSPAANPPATAAVPSSPSPAIAPTQPSGPLPHVNLSRVFPSLTFEQMTGMYQAPGDPGHYYVLEQRGRILVFDNRADVTQASVFLDIRDKVTVSSEEGLLGLAFAPDFASSGVFYVNYSAANPRRSIVARYSTPAPHLIADRNSESVILTQNQPFPNHNGGETLFGPDGYLYIGFGDGGSARDPMGNGQNRAVLLGKLLRIDVSASGAEGLAYRIPPDNPFVGQSGVRPEIYAYGLRNPWRFSWDPATGALWLADVGQDAREEIDSISKGGNYGWSVMEGSRCLGGGNGCDRTGLLPPVFDYANAGDNCSITGGFVYRGRAIAALEGAYVYGDYCSGRIWGLRWDGNRVTEQAELADAPFQLSSFAIDSEGELYALAYGSSGGIFKITP